MNQGLAPFVESKSTRVAKLCAGESPHQADKPARALFQPPSLPTPPRLGMRPDAKDRTPAPVGTQVFWVLKLSPVRAPPGEHVPNGGVTSMKCSHSPCAAVGKESNQTLLA